MKWLSGTRKPRKRRPRVLSICRCCKKSNRADFFHSCGKTSYGRLYVEVLAACRKCTAQSFCAVEATARSPLHSLHPLGSRHYCFLFGYGWARLIELTLESRLQ